MTVRVVLTVVEIALVVGVLAFALLHVSRLLGSISARLGRVAFGVRAVETHASALGPALRAANDQLADVAARLEELADRGERRAP